MPSTSTSSPYSTLDNKRKEIRLVTIKPSSEPTADIECELSTVSLCDIPGYKALSYVWWGSPSSGLRILVNGQHFKFTGNLYSALRRFRHPSEACVFWIDAICINQEDKLERASQVSLMRWIYRRAVETVVWLGEPRTSDLAMELLEKMPSDGNRHDMLELGYDTDYSEHWQALGAMLSNQYWERCWTLQEIIVSENITILHGAHSTSWDRLTLLGNLSHKDHLSPDCKAALCTYYLQ